MTEREERLNPYNKDSLRAAANAALNLRQQIGHNKGVMYVNYGDNHGCLQIDVFVLTEEYINKLKGTVPEEFEGFGVAFHAPYWSIGELCPQYKEQVHSYPICFFDSPKARERNKFYDYVTSEEKKKWDKMNNIERRIFIDNLIETQRKSGWEDAGNCYENWRNEGF
ncbi:MAG: hypothetical protein JW749_03955 [Sedimentisphaerales bacterium]|nr:hypothetical protein [Sedimentisphaerales bacterium]